MNTRATPASLAVAAALAAAVLACVVPSAAAGAGGPRGLTGDRDADGRPDSIRLHLPARAMPGLRFSVRGHRVRGVRWVRELRGRAVVVVRLSERGARDSGARPLVSLMHGGRLLRRIRPRDGARPVPLAARALDAPSGDCGAFIALTFSEPVRFRGAARGGRVLRVSGARVESIPRVRLKRVVRARLARTSALPASARVRFVRAARVPRFRDRAGNASVALAVALAAAAGGGCRDEDGSRWHTLSNPIDPKQQLALPWGTRSHWLQPWRAYLDTPPAARFRAAVGINFNVPPEDASATARLLADSGFRRARVEIPWGAMSYEDPERLKEPAAVRARVLALRANGIRPLILLNSNHGVPGPAQFFQARVTEPAAEGARQLRVDDTTRRQLIPGLTGFNGLDGKAAEFLVTSVSSGGLVRLSKPLPVPVPAGEYRAAVLRYGPFARPLTPSGEPNPAFERTLAGWLRYVGAATRAVRDMLGTDDFDVEIWNEENFGADFLWVERYYDPVPPELAGRGEVDKAILRRTVAYLRDPANGVAGVRIGNGFANQSPFPSGSTSPAGLTALDKHPYRGPLDFPGPPLGATRAVNADGEPSEFTPEYRAFLPEYFLTGIQTETLIRDLSPLTTTIGRVEHGRSTKPPGTAAPLEMWVTETALPPGGTGLHTPAETRRLQAKATLRALTAFVNKGVSALYFYAVRDRDYAMVDPAAPDGGLTMTAVRRLTAAMAGPPAVGRRRSLSLDAISDPHDHVQFAGDGSSEHPPLRNREVVAFLPFQADDTRFVVPAYVMTRDLSKPLAPETYRLTVGGIEADRLTARATDPLTGQSVPVAIVSRSGGSAVLQVELTDSPRLLLLEDG